jgi:hypothetical protein
MRQLFLGMIVILALPGCSKGPDRVVEGIIHEYGLMVTSLKAETSCGSAVETVRNLRNTGRQKLRELVKAYGKLGDEDKQKVSADLTKQAGTLNSEYFKPFKSRCPVEAAKIAAEMDAVLQRFKASLAPY